MCLQFKTVTCYERGVFVNQLLITNIMSHSDSATYGKELCETAITDYLYTAFIMTIVNGVQSAEAGC